MANTKISALSTATPLTGSEVLPVVQNGVTKKVTTDQFLIKDASGNVGLGVTPNASSVPTIETQYGVFAGITGAIITHNAFYDGEWQYSTNNFASRYVQQNGVHSWSTALEGTAGNPISFTQAMTLTVAGELLVNRSVASGLGKLNVEGGADFTNGDVYIGRDAGSLLVGTTSASGRFTVRQDSDTESPIYVINAAISGKFASFEGNGVVRGSITWSGSTTSFNTSSDARLKENISNADNGSALIDGLQVRKFNWKSDGSHQRFGFVAQELDAVYPEAVSKPADPDEMMGVDYSKLVPLLVQEIQSLRARLAAAGI